MTRLPIRWRLALAFAVAMAVVLSALGAFVYVRLENSLTDGLDETLEVRTAQIGSPIELTSTGDEEVAQFFDGEGGLLASSPSGQPPILSRDDVERARAGSFTVEREGKRVLVSQSGSETLAVGLSTEDRDEALRSLLAQLLIVGPLALILTSLGGYFLAASALRPVDAMRREAEAVSALEPGRRLSLPSAKDELRRLGETLNRMLARLETALERERRFVADASHELRTPLAMLRAELELALRRERAPEELKRVVRSAAEETERLSRLAEDLLVLARANGGKLPVHREDVPASELVEAVAERFRPHARAAGRIIDVASDDGLVVYVDRLRAEQALGNLVDNALRHGVGRISVEAKRTDGAAELHVRDEGHGLPPELAERAFEPFTRGDAARTGPSAGLGLSIVDVIARAHGGSAHVSGADVWLDLPAGS